MLGASRNCGQWCDVEAVRLLETILETTILEDMLSNNNLEFFVTLVGGSIWGSKL